MKSNFSFLVTMAIFLFVNAASAAQPTVKCSLEGTKGFKIGSQSETIYVPLNSEENLSVTLGKFTLEPSLNATCAADGGPCSGYSLKLALAHESGVLSEVKFYVSKTVRNVERMLLTVGSKAVMAICNINRD